MITLEATDSIVLNLTYKPLVSYTMDPEHDMRKIVGISVPSRVVPTKAEFLNVMLSGFNPVCPNQQVVPPRFCIHAYIVSFWILSSIVLDFLDL